MKKIYFSAAVALLLATASCQNEVIVEEAQGREFRVEVSVGGGSRTHIGQDGTMTWSEGDQIYVGNLDDPETGGVLTLVSGAGTPNAVFSGLVKGGSDLQYSVFPVPGNDGKIDLTNRDAKRPNAPLISTFGNGGGLTFEKTCGMVRLNVSGGDELVIDQKAEAGQTQHLGGTAKVVFNSTTNKYELEYTRTGAITMTNLPESGIINIPVVTEAVTSTGVEDNLGSGKTELEIVVDENDEVNFSLEIQTGAVNTSNIPTIEVGEDGSVSQAVVWDGKTVDTSWYDEKKSSFEITTATELAGLAKLVNEGVKFRIIDGETAVYQTIELTANIDLGGNKWTPIGHGTKDNVFQGIFDGKGHIVSNYTVEGEAHLGLFGSFSYGKLLNLNVKNVYIRGNKYAGSLIGWAQNGATKNDEDNISYVENCSAEKVEVILTPNKDMEDGKHAGGLVGYAVRFKILNCHINGFDVVAYHSCGGLLGTVNGPTCVIKGNTVENGTVIADQTVEYKDTMKDTYQAGEIVGSKLNYEEIDNNTFKTVSVKTLKK